MRFVFIISMVLVVLLSCKEDRVIESGTDILLGQGNTDTLNNSEKGSTSTITEVQDSMDNVRTYCRSISHLLVSDEGNFMGSTDENDLYGHPDYETENLIVWKDESFEKMEVYFNAATQGKEYSMYFMDSDLIFAFEGNYTDTGPVGDSLFFRNNELVQWKTPDGGVVRKKSTVAAKQEYISMLFKEIDRTYHGHSNDSIHPAVSAEVIELVQQNTE